MRALVVLLLVLAACQSEPDRGGFGEQPAPPTTAPSAPSASPSDDPVDERRVEVSALPGPTYSTGTLRARAGEILEVLLRNADDQDHTFVVDDLPLVILAAPGQAVSARVPIHPDRRGRFPFYCQIDGHRGLGMEGTLRVSR